MSAPAAQVRPRRDADVPALATLLAAQQPTSRYPLRWPLPYPAERFVVRPGQEAAWVATMDDDVVGHVAVAPLGEGSDAATVAAYAEAMPGRDVTTVSVLFVDPALHGRGIGTALLGTAVDHVRGSGREPVLDVVPLHAGAVAFYAARGWTEVGRARPGWLLESAPDVHLMTLDG